MATLHQVQEQRAAAPSAAESERDITKHRQHCAAVAALQRKPDQHTKTRPQTIVGPGRLVTGRRVPSSWGGSETGKDRQIVPYNVRNCNYLVRESIAPDQDLIQADLTRLDVLQRVDELGRIEARFIGQRLAERLAGQRHQPSPAQPLDLVGQRVFGIAPVTKLKTAATTIPRPFWQRSLPPVFAALLNALGG